DIRRDNLLNLWRQYGNYAIGVAVAIVAAVAVYSGWQSYETRQRETMGARYAAALDLVTKEDASAAGVFHAIGTAGGGHALLARFEEAALRAKAGDATAAIAVYDNLAGDTGVDPIYRDLARLLAARYRIDKNDAKAAIARLAPLIDSANPWHS